MGFMRKLVPLCFLYLLWFHQAFCRRMWVGKFDWNIQIRIQTTLTKTRSNDAGRVCLQMRILHSKQVERRELFTNARGLARDQWLCNMLFNINKLNLFLEEIKDIREWLMYHKHSQFWSTLLLCVIHIPWKQKSTVCDEILWLSHSLLGNIWIWWAGSYFLFVFLVFWIHRHLLGMLDFMGKHHLSPTKCASHDNPVH